MKFGKIKSILPVTEKVIFLLSFDSYPVVSLPFRRPARTSLGSETQGQSREMKDRHVEPSNE